MKKITLLCILLAVSFGYSQNLALSGTASASSELQPASNANDGNTGTRWESVHGPLGDITIDLGASYDIGQILLNWEGAFADEYEILISDDPTFAASTTIYTTTTGDGGIDDLAVTGTGQYVRMNGIHRFLNAYGYSLYEFEIYEAADPLTDATLSDLTVNGTTVADFSINTLIYNVVLPQGTTVVPTVVATTSQGTASAVVTDATSLPGTTSVLVTAEDGTTTNTYNLNFTVQVTPVSTTFDLTFEPGTPGSNASYWNSFENGVNPPFEVVANPDPTGVNTTATVGKYTSLAGVDMQWAGCENQHGTIWKWELDATSTTLTIDIYKSVISDVMVKIITETNGTVYAVQQPNTVINEWETLTYDISGLVAHGENHDLDQIVVHSDIVNPRATDNVAYFDNISWEGLITANAPALGVADFQTTKFKVYPNPTQNTWNIKSSNQIINSVQVFDVLGKQVISLNPNSEEVSIDASTLPAGLYFARIKSEIGSNSIKLIKK
jgi:hypothetical protein